MSFFEFPNTRTYDNDLGWLIKTVNSLKETMDHFISFNTIKYANPIQWSIDRQYESNMVVIDPSSGVAYLSVQPVPLGVAITNSDYWTPIFDYTFIVQRLEKEIAEGFELGNTAVNSHSKGELLWWNDYLFIVTADISAGSGIAQGANVEPITIEEFINRAVTALQNSISDLENSFNEQLENTKYWYTPEDYGAVGDGVTDDSAAFQAMFDDIPTGAIVKITKNRYLVNSTITITVNDCKVLGVARGEYTPNIHSTMSRGLLFAVRSYGFRIESILFSSDNIANALTLLDFNRDTVEADGNIDANVIDCGFYSSYIGCGCNGRNVNFINNIFTSCRRGIMLYQPSVTAIESRGYWIKSNRFHGDTYAIYNEISNTTGVKNIIIDGNFSDVSNTFFAGTGGAVYIANNVIDALSGTGSSQMITLTADALNSAELMNVIQNNILMGGSYTTDGIFIAANVKVEIIGNTIKRCNRNGIGISSGCLAFVKGNTVILGSTTSGSYPLSIAADAAGACVDNLVYNTKNIAGAAGMTVERNTQIIPS